MYIYIVRHGQSMGNLKGGFAGHTDYPLSDLGHKQARITADFLKDEHIETVISSTLTRAKQTAEPIAADRGLEVIGCKEFMEMNFGDWEGKPLDEVEREYNGAVSQWKKEMYKTVCPNGESTVDCYNRAVNALKETAAKYDGHDIC
ncbi:MAG: histidine phosphatase family protein, partial [Clostridia bacterium]|nr:histidine phosphatase family protein [Clostridia bacterium]